KIERLARYRAAVLDYELPVVFMRGELENVREAFLRVNTQGMKITTAERIFARAEELDLRRVLHEIRDPLHDGFGALDEHPILFAMVALNGGEEARGSALDLAVGRIEEKAKSDPRFKRSLARQW